MQIIFPAEVCYILPGQLYRKKIPEELYTKDVTSFATLKPAERLQMIQGGIGAGRSGSENSLPPPVSAKHDCLDFSVVLKDHARLTATKTLLLFGMQGWKLQRLQLL